MVPPLPSDPVPCDHPPLSLDEARQRVLAVVRLTGAESARLDECVGRTTACALTADHDQPPFAASAMDGYAVRRADLGGWLSLVGEAAAGHPFDRRLRMGEAVRIGTGARVPDGADHVLIQEEAERDGGRVRATQPQPRPRNIREAGRDFAAGDVLLRAGSRIEARHVGLLAAANQTTLNVRRRPNIGVITSGDELVDPGTELSGAQIVDSASVGLPALARRWGAQCAWIGRSPDKLDEAAALWRQPGSHDLMVSVGGASVGDRDFLRLALEQAGGRVLWSGVAMRPGKPSWMGEIAGVPVLGLPGNPAAALVVARLLLRPALEAMLGTCDRDEPLVGRLAEPMPANGWRDAHERARRSLDGDGSVRLHPVADGDSSRLSPFATADALIVRPAGADAAAAEDLVHYRMI